MSRFHKSVLNIALAMAIFLGIAAALRAQNNPPPAAAPAAPSLPAPFQGFSEGDETRIFDIKYADVNVLAQTLSIFNVQINPSPTLHVLAVRARKSIMPAIVDAIQRFDVPPAPAPPAKNVDLIMYVISATDQQDSTPLPAGLQPVVNQLRNVLSYKGFQVIDTQVARGMSGRQLQTSGHMPYVPKPADVGAVTPPPTTYNFTTSIRVRGTDKEPVVFLEGMRFGVNVPNWGANGTWQFYNVGINSDVEIPRGQQVVVGKTTVGDRALILVISAKVLD